MAIIGTKHRLDNYSHPYTVLAKYSNYILPLSIGA